MKKGDLILVEWFDHFSSRNGGWRAYGEFNGKTLPAICHSVGVVVDSNKHVIILAQNWHPEENNVADFMVVIRSCIKKITNLKKKVLK